MAVTAKALIALLAAVATAEVIDFRLPQTLRLVAGGVPSDSGAQCRYVLGPVPGVDVMAKRSQGWVKCEDRLPYYKGSSCSLPLATTP
jgi:hypothetical protein